MKPSELFARSGQMLFGTGAEWKAQFGRALKGIKPDSIDAMTKGKSRINPRIWREVATLLQDREAIGNLSMLKLDALERADAEQVDGRMIEFRELRSRGGAEIINDIAFDLCKGRFEQFAEMAGRPGTRLLQRSGGYLVASAPDADIPDASMFEAFRMWLANESANLNRDFPHKVGSIQE